MFIVWKNSLGHDAAMLDKTTFGEYQTKFGFGFALDSDNMYYATQEFAEDDIYDVANRKGTIWTDYPQSMADLDAKVG